MRERELEDLLEKIAVKDEEAFHQFYCDTARSVYSYILSLAVNSHEAEDLMQETYLKVWVCASDYRPQGKPLAWVFTIAKNLCYMRFREKKRQAETDFGEDEEREEGQVCDSIEQAPERALLLGALSQLKEVDRQVVLLYAASGLKHREVADVLKLPLATELAKYNRSMKRLQQILGQCVS